MPARPKRVKIENEAGSLVSLPDGPQTLAFFGHGDNLLILCPGPDISLCISTLPQARRIFLLQSPEFADQMPAEWGISIPKDWIMITLDQAKAMLPTVRVLHYLPATRLFPSMYAPLLASLNTPAPGLTKTRTILMPGTEHSLITQECARAIHSLGYVPKPIPASLPVALLHQHIEQEQPALFLSLNFHGLDSFGENQALLDAARVPVAVWCVDNPFHLLTCQKNKLWKHLSLFVTDDWFVEPLRQMGATVSHLPLGTDPALFSGPQRKPERTLSFVGRSQFPDRDRFFAAQTVPETLMHQAAALPGRQADFGWWHETLGFPPLWPGQAVRAVGLGAEQSSALWRIRCLKKLAQTGCLDIIGDAYWKNLIPGARVHEPVDYYHGLAEIYARSAYSLNLTSLLLPHGLTQRHFDVWSAHGFLLTDNSPGLQIFPQELTRPISFMEPEQAREQMHFFASHQKHKEELARAWHELITTDHSYTKRMETILNLCAASK